MAERSKSAITLIEASAGTGKTETLVRRMIDELERGFSPKDLVSLTFSRAAAGEIFQRLVSTLAADAKADPSKVRLLRAVISTQHLSLIGTLDGFLMRIVKSFPLELNLAGDYKLMDEFSASRAKARVSFGILKRTDAATRRSFLSAFKEAEARSNNAKFTDTYLKFINTWHEFYLEHYKDYRWGFDSFRVDERFLKETALRLKAIKVRKQEKWDRFADWVGDFNGTFEKAPTIWKNLIAIDRLMDVKSITISVDRCKETFAGEELRVVQDAVRLICAYMIALKSDMARGIFSLLKPFEAEYDRLVRSRGNLEFSDLPRLIMNLGDEVRKYLEFRLDSRFSAWGLDEFQDTSREQWEALKNLIDEACQSEDGKEVLIVGDSKQAIYGWRKGDVRILKREKESRRYEIKSQDRSWRYGSEICEAITTVFTSGAITSISELWECRAHETARCDRHGWVLFHNLVGSKRADFYEGVYNELMRTKPWEKSVKCAVLVRDNRLGIELVELLRSRGIRNVVFEGDSKVLDTPVLSAFLDLTFIADHPGDEKSFRHFVLSPLKTAWYGERAITPEEVSLDFARLFSSIGLVRTFRVLRAKLDADLGEFTESRFVDMLSAAAAFEELEDSAVKVSDFTDFLRARKKREAAQEGMIRVMTIHHSKGLTLDYVIVPLYESGSFSSHVPECIVSEEEKWLLPNPGRDVVAHSDALKKAVDEAYEIALQDELSAYYVALTRAKYAMTVLLPEKIRENTFAAIIRDSGVSSTKNVDYRLPDLRGEADIFEETDDYPVIERRKRKELKRRLPSVAALSGRKASELFDEDASGLEAMKRGSTLHDEMSKIEFSDEARYRGALSKPEGFIELWRERAFELSINGEWISGRFDRVVFFEKDGERHALIQDFKTGSREGMAAKYYAQMSAYRDAVAVLADIDKRNIQAELLTIGGIFDKIPLIFT